MRWWQEILPVAQGANAAFGRAAHPLPGPIARIGLAGACIRRFGCSHVGSPALSRIFYRRRFFDYPLTLNAARSGIWGSSRQCKIGLSYGRAQLKLQIAGDYLGRFSRQSFRRSTVPHILQELHREGVGRALRGDFRGMGRSAHQRLVGCESDCTRAGEPFSQLDRRRSKADRNQPDRAISLSEIRTRSNVGGGGAASYRAWRTDSSSPSGGSGRARRPSRSPPSMCLDESTGAVRRVPCDHLHLNHARSAISSHFCGRRTRSFDA